MHMEKDFGYITLTISLKLGIVRPEMFKTYFPDNVHTPSETEPSRTSIPSFAASSIGKSPSLEKPASLPSLTRSTVYIPEPKRQPPVYSDYRPPPLTPTAPTAALPDPPQTSAGFPAPSYQQATVDLILGRGDLTSDQKVNLIRDLTLNPTASPSGNAYPSGMAPTSHATQPTGASGPNPLISTSSSVSLPPFHGNEGEFVEWWQYFTQMVDMNPALLPIEKLKMLKESLRGKVKFLAQQTQMEEGAYDFIKQRLWVLYGDSVSTVMMLKRRLQQWETIKPDNFMSLAEFVAFMHQYIRQVGAVDGGQHFNCNETLYLFEAKFHYLMKLDYRRCIRNREMDNGRMTNEQKLRYMMDWVDELVTFNTSRTSRTQTTSRHPLAWPCRPWGLLLRTTSSPRIRQGQGQEGGEEDKGQAQPHNRFLRDAGFNLRRRSWQLRPKLTKRSAMTGRRTIRVSNKDKAGDGKGDSKASGVRRLWLCSSRKAEKPFRLRTKT